MLTNLAMGRKAHHHCQSQSDYGGLDGTIRSLVERGLINWECELTDAGKEYVKSNISKEDDDE